MPVSSVDSVEFGATAKELEVHFHGCGSVNHECDKFRGHSKGFEYTESADKE
jgi:hypothetical protein